MSGEKTMGERYLVACERAGADPWRGGMSDAATGWRLVAPPRPGPPVMASPGLCVALRGNMYGLVPDLFDPATFGAALAVYDDLRGRSVPNRVLTRVAAHGIGSREAVEALVTALEALAAGGAP